MKQSCHNCQHQKRSMLSPFRGEFAKCMASPEMRTRTGHAKDNYKEESYVHDHYYCSTVAKNCPAYNRSWAPDLTTRIQLWVTLWATRLWKGW